VVGAEHGTVIAAGRAGWAGLAVAAALGCAAVAPEQRDAPAGPGAPGGPGGDATEAAIVRAVDASNPAAITLLQRIVDINSGTMNLAGVREVGAVLRAQLGALGFTTRWVDGAGFGRAGHLVAEHRAAGPHLLLIGHLDTVFEPSSPFQRFERLSDTAARGPGVCDMKGGDVIIVHALHALNDAGVLDRMAITVVMTGDEEHPGEPLAEARRALIDAASGAAAAIGFEDGAGDPRTAVIARRGASDWLLCVSAVPAHSSQIHQPDVGAGAIFETARVLDAFRDSLAAEPYLTFSPGVIVGGTTIEFDGDEGRGRAFGKTNVVPETTMVEGDLRALSLAQLEHAQAVMRAIVAASLPHTRGTLRFKEGYPPLAPTDGNRALLQQYDRASRDLGFGPVEAVDPSRAGAADVSFTSGLTPRALDGIGLRGTGGHTTQETGNLRSLPVQAKRVAVMLARLATGTKSAAP